MDGHYHDIVPLDAQTGRHNSYTHGCTTSNGHSPFQKSYHRYGSVGIQPSGWLIKEQHMRFNDELHTNVGSLSLSSRHSTEKFIANLYVYTKGSVTQ